MRKLPWLALVCVSAWAAQPVRDTRESPGRPLPDNASMALTARVSAPADAPLFDAVAELAFDPGGLLLAKGVRADFDPRTIRVHEITANGKRVAAPTLHQFEPARDGAATATLLVYLEGITRAGTTRTFEVRLGSADRGHDVRNLITVIDNVTDIGEPAFKIVTPNSVFFLQKKSHGVSTLIDRDGANWISFNPAKGSAGEFRGLPNIAPVEFHPGHPTGKQDLRLVAAGPLKAVIEGATLDDKWRTRWEVYPTFTRITVTTPGDTPYWLLYEGTPAGKLQPERQYVLLSDGARLPLTERWQRDLPGPEWAAFGDTTKPRVLFVAHPEDDSLVEQYWPMEGNMTVFGFGRGRGATGRSVPLLTATRSTMLFGIIDTDDAAEITRRVQATLATARLEMMP